MFNPLRHHTVLIRALRDFFSDTFLAPVLGFKGGTAAHLFYGLQRFSVDLDFDLTEPDIEKDVMNRMEALLKPYGVIKDQFIKRHSFYFVLSYEAKHHNIKIEVSLRNFGSEYKVLNYLGIPMRVMKQEDMFANKLAALLERKKPANRDLFDIWFFLKNDWDLKEAFIVKRTGLPVKEYLKKCVGFIEKVNQRQILSGMGELLDNKLKTWAKRHLIDELLFLLKLKLKTFDVSSREAGATGSFGYGA